MLAAGLLRHCNNYMICWGDFAKKESLLGTLAERTRYEIAGAGYGIHWPDLDEDVGVEGMLLGKKSTESPKSLTRWLAARREN